MRKRNRAGAGSPAPEGSDAVLTRAAEVFQRAAEVKFGRDGFVTRQTPDGRFIVEPIGRGRDVLHRRTFAAEATAIDSLGNEVDLSFSSEAPVERGGTAEILSHDPADADFGILRTVGSILMNHDPDKVIGAPVSVALDEAGRRGRLRMRFGTDPAGAAARHQVLVDQTLRGVSVGYSVAEWIFLPDAEARYRGRIPGPAWVAVRWQAREASLTPIPADPSVGIGRSAVAAENEAATGAPAAPVATETDEDEKQNKESRTMDEKQNKAAAEAAAVVPAVDTRSIEERATVAERARVNEINALGRKFALDASAVDAMVAEGVTAADAGRRVLEILAERNKPVVTVKVDGRESFVRAAINGLAMRAGQKRDEQAGGDDLAGLRMIELARECLRRAGLSDKGRPVDVAGRALRGPRIDAMDFRAAGETITAGVSDFAYILASTARKAMLEGFRTAPQTWREWCKRGSLADFKATARIKLSESGDLESVPENANYPTGKFSDKQETITLGTYGKKFGISRQAIVNDDLDAFSALPMKFGRAAARLPNKLAVAKLLQNPAMTDGVALFAAGHNNYSASSAYAFDTAAHGEAGLANAIKTLRKQKAMMQTDEGNEANVYLGLEPRTLLVGPTAEFYAKLVVGSASVPSVANGGIINPLRGVANVVVEPSLEDTLLTGYSTTAWYLFADPVDAPVIEVAFLDGVEEPYMEELDQTDSDGRIWKVRLDCAAAAIDYAGAVKENGA